MKTNMIISVGFIAFGVALLILGVLDMLDSYWSGCGGAMIGVGASRLYRQIRYSKDAAYKEAADTARKDERNQFLANKAMCWAAYVFVIISSLGAIAARLAGNTVLSVYLGFSVFILMILYWLCYLYLKKKY